MGYHKWAIIIHAPGLGADDYQVGMCAEHAADDPLPNGWQIVARLRSFDVAIELCQLMNSR